MRERQRGVGQAIAHITDPAAVAVSGTDRHPSVRATGDLSDEVPLLPPLRRRRRESAHLFADGVDAAAHEAALKTWLDGVHA